MTTWQYTWRSLLDRAGIVVSLACLAHCLLPAVLTIMLPTMVDSVAHEDSFAHWTLLGIALLISALAFSIIWRRRRDVLVLTGGGAGLVLLFLGAAHLPADTWETPLTVSGALLLLTAHLRSWLLQSRTDRPDT